MASELSPVPTCLSEKCKTKTFTSSKSRWTLSPDLVPLFNYKGQRAYSSISERWTYGHSAVLSVPYEDTAIPSMDVNEMLNYPS